MSFGNMDDYSLSDLAGSGAIILASIGGLLTIILSSRCYIKCRLGLTDNCNVCMCERKPPPDPENPDEDDKKKKKKTGVPAEAPVPQIMESRYSVRETLPPSPTPSTRTLQAPPSPTTTVRSFVSDQGRETIVSP